MAEDEGRVWNLQNKIDWQLSTTTDQRGVQFVELRVSETKLNKLIEALEHQLKGSYCPSEISVDDKRGSKNYNRNLLWVQMTC